MRKKTENSIFFSNSANSGLAFRMETFLLKANGSAKVKIIIILVMAMIIVQYRETKIHLNGQMGPQNQNGMETMMWLGVAFC
jgi:hypothetical protein